ncbi:MAG TPA: hypothetical protein VJP78_03100 [Thermoleophilia bacterium]|nr:hypothetical protein [Thermoleophilia bacterium]
MIAESIAVRSATFAFLFPTQPELKREDNLHFYDKVTSSGVDLPEFQQRQNQVLLRRVTAGTPPHAFAIQIDHFKQQLRFLISEEFPRRPLELIQEDADSAWEAFRQIWSLERLGGRPILAEVTMRSTAAAEGGNATKYLLDRVLKVSHTGLHKLGRQVQGLGLRLVLPVQLGVGDKVVPLAGADGNLLIETLLDDPSKVFLQLTSKWPTLSIPPGVGPPGIPRDVNAEIRKPSQYLQDVYDFLHGSVTEFILEAAK